MTDPQVQCEDLRTILRKHGVATSGMTFQEMQNLYMLSIAPDMFVQKFFAQHKQRYPNIRGLKNICDNLDAQVWTKIFFDVFSKDSPEDLSFYEPAQTLVPDMPLWVSLAIFLSFSRTNRIEYARCAFKADPRKPLMATHAIKTRLAAYDPKDHEDEYKALYSALYDFLC